MRKGSFSVERRSSNTDYHNTRLKSPKYLIETDKNFDGNYYKKNYEYDEFLDIAQKLYQETVKQKMQKKQIENLFQEAVISLEKHHTEHDIYLLFKDLKKEYGGHELINLAIHRDEGHFLKDGIEFYPTKHILFKNGNWYITKDLQYARTNEDFCIKVDINQYEKVYNYHAHAVFSMFDLDKGKSARMSKKDMSSRIKFVSDKLGMLYAPGKNRLVKKHINQHKQDLSEQRNIKVQQLATQKDLKEENKKLRAMLQEQKASRPEYAQLEQINKDLKQKIKDKNLTIEDLKLTLDDFKSLFNEEKQKLELELDKQRKATDRQVNEAQKLLSQERLKNDELVQKVTKLEQEVYKYKSWFEELNKLLTKKMNSIEDIYNAVKSKLKTGYENIFEKINSDTSKYYEKNFGSTNDKEVNDNKPTKWVRKRDKNR